MSANPLRFHMAIDDFQSARQRAALQEILAHFTGKSTQLLSYQDVAERLKLRVRTDRGLQSIPLEAIVGSVGRYSDFTRSFLPRREEDQERWARLKAAVADGASLPPIEVYKVGEAYFVLDGNHRVSIARQQGQTDIEAHVIEFHTDVNFTADLQVEDLMGKAEYAEFLEATRLHRARPNVDLSVTSCCQYDKLVDQISATWRALQEDAQHGGPLPPESFEQAAAYWYDTVYIPLAEAIRDRALLQWFPGRTVTDLYIWISENRAALEQELGWEIQSPMAATDLIVQGNARSESGAWRKARTVARYSDHLFMDILVPLSGDAESWDALSQAIVIAKREAGSIHGLHVVDTEARASSAAALAVQAHFHQQCAQAGVEGRLAIEVGDITRKIRERTMGDLIVLKVAHPPGGGLAALRSPYRSIIAEASRPVLGVPAAATRFERAVLAYDGSELAREALFVAAYFAEVWKTELVVFTAQDGGKVKADVHDHVRRYLDLHEVTAEYIVKDQNVTDCLKQTVEEMHADLVLMGSHGGGVVQQVLIGSALDYMLRESSVPVFICR